MWHKECWKTKLGLLCLICVSIAAHEGAYALSIKLCALDVQFTGAVVQICQIWAPMRFCRAQTSLLHESFLSEDVTMACKCGIASVSSLEVIWMAKRSTPSSKTHAACANGWLVMEVVHQLCNWTFPGVLDKEAWETLAYCHSRRDCFVDFIECVTKIILYCTDNYLSVSLGVSQFLN